jgi:hypothetical protein
VSAATRENGTTSRVYLGPIFVDVIAKPGETRDLGDLRAEIR